MGAYCESDRRGNDVYIDQAKVPQFGAAGAVEQAQQAGGAL